MTIANVSEQVLVLLWRASWQAALLAVVVFLIVALTRRWISAKWRVALWSLPLCRLLLLAVPTTSVSMFSGFSAVVERAVERPAAAVPTTVVPVNPGVGNGDVPLRTGTLSFAANPPLPSPVEAELETAEASRPWSFSFAIVGAWLIGCMLALARWWSSHRALRRLLAHSEPLSMVRPPDSLSSFVTQEIRRYRTRCLVTGERIGPATTGVLRPTIILSRQLADELSDHELDSVLRHELQHVRRRDALLLMLCRVAVVIHWFNPLSYILGRCIRRETELAVDAAMVENLAGEHRQDYGQLLIRLARQPGNRFGLAQMADAKSNLRHRVESIATPCHMTPARSVCAMAIVAILVVTGLSDVAQTQEQTSAPSPSEIGQSARASTTDLPAKSEQTYCVTGTVREEGTGKPVAGAEVQLLVDSEQDPKKRVPATVTDEKGNYRIEVPMGSVRLWYPQLKPGYWLPAKDAMQALVTSPEQPEAVHDIAVKQGRVWNVQAEGELGENPLVSALEEADPAKRQALLKGETVMWQESPPQAFDELDKSGRGALTQVGTSGGLIVRVGNTQAELVVERGFDNTSVISATPLPGSDATEMVDAAGKKATITNASVTLQDGVPLLTFRVNPVQPIATQKLKGRVIDQVGEPIAGARIGIAAGKANQGSAAMPQATETSTDGRFQIDVPIKERSSEGTRFAAIITKEGYAAVDTAYVDATTDFDEIDFGTVELKKGHVVPVLVIGKDGAPVPGAVIEPASSYALRRQATRTDASGRAVLKNLSAGIISVTAQHGSAVASSKLIVSDGENTEVTLRLKEVPTPAASEQRPEPLALGSIAPEWDVRGWSDGANRKLADYRGKVVVLDFWGLWCSPCINAIPAMKQLAEEYETDDVVFIGIHTADGDAEQVEKLKQLHGWEMITAIDHGTSITDGATCSAYRVRGYPTVVIVDDGGKIAYRSDVEPEDREAFMEEVAELAKVENIVWPPDEGAPEAEQIETMNKIMRAMLSRELDGVLER